MGFAGNAQRGGTLSLQTPKGQGSEDLMDVNAGQ